jgi:LysR family positive regulator for ilvC
MNIRELELFKHLAGSLHFGRTSLECNITPSALTRTIQRLEGETGKQLFLRDNRSVSLTPAGILFREYCEETIGRWNILQNNLQSDTVLRGKISLYCSVTAILSILPRILIRFRKIHPQVSIHIQTGDAAKALNKLHNREVDISIAALPEKTPENLDCIEILKTPLIFIAPRFFPEAIFYSDKNSKTIDWEKTPLILPKEGLSRIRAERWFSEKQIAPNLYSQVSGNEAIIAMVGMGCGVGVVPRLVLDKSTLADEIEILEVTPRLKPFTVGGCISTRNRNNPVVQSFWKILMKTISTCKSSDTIS